VHQWEQLPKIDDFADAVFLVGRSLKTSDADGLGYLRKPNFIFQNQFSAHVEGIIRRRPKQTGMCDVARKSGSADG